MLTRFRGGAFDSEFVFADFPRRRELQRTALAHHHLARTDMRILKNLFQREHRSDATIFTAELFDPVSLRLRRKYCTGLRLAPVRIATACQCTNFPVTSLEVGALQDNAHTIPEVTLQRAHSHMAAISDPILRIEGF